MTWTSVIATSLRYTIYPPAYLLSFLATVLQALASPFLQLGGYLLHISLFPFRVLAKFENICIFFGTAVVIGLVTGLVLYFTSSFIIQILQLSPETSLSSRRRRPSAGRGLQQRFNRFPRFQPRSENVQKSDVLELDDSQSSTRGISSSMKKKAADGYYATWKDENRGEPKERGLLSTMILEEDDDNSGSDGS